MLRELIGEFPPAARILVLVLHPRRAERIALGGLLHAELLDALGGSLGLLGELLARLGRRAVAAAPDHDRARALRIDEAEMQAGESAHRQADDVRPVDFQRIEHGTDVVARALL